MNWPIGSGKEFKGVFDRKTQKLLGFTANNGQKEVEKTELALDDPAFNNFVNEYQKKDLFDEIELLDGAQATNLILTLYAAVNLLPCFSVLL